jgi:hypothetical protein
MISEEPQISEQPSEVSYEPNKQPSESQISEQPIPSEVSYEPQPILELTTQPPIQILENGIQIGSDHIATEIRSNTISRKLKILLKLILSKASASLGIVLVGLVAMGTLVGFLEHKQGGMTKEQFLAFCVLFGMITQLPLYMSVATLRSIYRTRYRYNSDIKTNYLNGTEKQCVIRKGTGKYKVEFGTSREFKIDGQDCTIMVNDETFNFFKTLKTATLHVEPLVGIPPEVLTLAAVVNYLRGKTRFVHHRARLLFLFGKMLTFAQYVSLVTILVASGGAVFFYIRRALNDSQRQVQL